MLAHLRKGETCHDLAAGFAIGTGTVYRYPREGIDLLAAMAPTLDEAIAVAPEHGTTTPPPATTAFSTPWRSRMRTRSPSRPSSFWADPNWQRFSVPASRHAASSGRYTSAVPASPCSSSTRPRSSSTPAPRSVCSTDPFSFPGI